MSRGRRLLLDEMLTPEIARRLRDLGHDVHAVAETVDLVAASDEEVLAEATAQDRALVTLNVRDFAVLDARWKAQARAHGGIAFVMTSTFPQDRSLIGALVTALGDLLARGPVPSSDAVVFLTRR